MNKHLKCSCVQICPDPCSHKVTLSSGPRGPAAALARELMACEKTKVAPKRQENWGILGQVVI